MVDVELRRAFQKVGKPAELLPFLPNDALLLVGVMQDGDLEDLLLLNLEIGLFGLEDFLLQIAFLVLVVDYLFGELLKVLVELVVEDG